MRQELHSKRASEIRGMFGRIAHRYDLLNRLLSLGQDVRWRRRVARRVAALRPARRLDVCTGTGDLALALDGPGTTYGSDFSFPMLQLARRKGERRAARLALFAADVAQLPIGDGALDLVTVGFGVRNFENLGAGLREMARVLRPGGRLLVLEFSRPNGIMAPLLRWWVRRVPPLVGRVVSGDPEAYGYLTASVRAFPDATELCAQLAQAGLVSVGVWPLTGGVATLYECVRESGV